MKKKINEVLNPTVLTNWSPHPHTPTPPMRGEEGVAVGRTLEGYQEGLEGRRRMGCRDEGFRRDGVEG